MSLRNQHALVGFVSVTTALVLMFVQLSAGHGLYSLVVPAAILVLASWYVMATRPRI